MNNLPPIDDLKLFCAVARNLSFVATANEWGCSPAFVTKRISLLESALRVRLLHRTTRRVSVTEDGHTVFRWAQRILEDFDEMSRAVSSSRTIPRGLLRISTSPGFGRKRVAPALSELVELYPSLRVHIELLDRPVDMLGEGFDIDVRIAGKYEPYFIVKRISANRRVLCAAPAYIESHGTPRELSDLGKHQCLVNRERDLPMGIWRLTGPEGLKTVKVSGPLSTNNGEIVYQWALDGHGIILRSTWDVSAHLKTGRLVRVLPEYYQDAEVCAVYPSRLAESAKVRVCVQFLAKKLKSEHGDVNDSGSPGTLHYPDVLL
ncbi:MAG: LysR family transcriptional regulator [Deltaproteobacteria bacterium]|nr:LysR family transcriptional regulator [Deltaproteobacteria bacterium]